VVVLLMRVTSAKGGWCELHRERHRAISRRSGLVLGVAATARFAAVDDLGHWRDTNLQRFCRQPWRGTRAIARWSESTLVTPGAALAANALCTPAGSCRMHTELNDKSTALKAPGRAPAVVAVPTPGKAVVAPTLGKRHFGNDAVLHDLRAEGRSLRGGFGDDPPELGAGWNLRGDLGLNIAANY